MCCTGSLRQRQQETLNRIKRFGPAADENRAMFQATDKSMLLVTITNTWESLHAM